MAEIAVKLLWRVGHFALSNTDEIADEWWIESLFADSEYGPCQRLRDCVTTGPRKSQGSEALIRGAGYYAPDLPGPNTAEVSATAGQE
jgi:hypothetical protein